MTVTFDAVCPCGEDCSWQQCGDTATVKAEDFTLDCPCEAAA